MSRIEQPLESLVLPSARDAGLLAVALAGVSASGPMMAATAAPALAIAFWRNALGAGGTGLVVGLRHRSEFAALDRRGWALASVAGVFLALHFGTWVPSVKLTSVASATALVATQSVFTGLIAAAAGRRLPRLAWLGMALAIVGTALIAGADFAVSARALAGDGLALLGGIFAAAYVTAGASARRGMSTATYTTICYGVCALGLLAACLAGGQPLGGFSGRAWVLILAVTGCAQLLGHSLINVVLRSVSATFVSLTILIEVPGAALIAAVWLHQRPPASAIPGLVLLLAGLVVVVRSRSRDRAVEPVPDLD
ncbi:MAG TPA: DMT family transporter [Jatrophihabitans sp.]|uniref:DMT family transporter n=1 Tax=Jatrophihabitans sp. TaxID=1932789 RepID=UPI002F190DD7